MTQNAITPDWFSPKNYEPLHSFDLRGWCVVTHHIWNVIWKTETHQDLYSSQSEAYRFWERHRLGAQTLEQMLNDSSSEYADFPFNEPVEKWPLRLIKEIEAAGPEVYDNRGRFQVELDLNCPDTILLELLEHWIQAMRLERPLVINSRGRTPTSEPKKVGFTQDYFNRWAEKNILGFFDIRYWARCNDIAMSHREVAEVLLQGAPPRNMNQWAFKVDEAYNEALGLRHALKAEVLAKRSITNKNASTLEFS